MHLRIPTIDYLEYPEQGKRTSEHQWELSYSYSRRCLPLTGSSKEPSARFAPSFLPFLEYFKLRRPSKAGPKTDYLDNVPNRGYTRGINWSRDSHFMKQSKVFS